MDSRFIANEVTDSGGGLYFSGRATGTMGNITIGPGVQVLFNRAVGGNGGGLVLELTFNFTLGYGIRRTGGKLGPRRAWLYV
jgi:hypothetical protein